MPYSPFVIVWLLFICRKFPHRQVVLPCRNKMWINYLRYSHICCSNIKEYGYSLGQEKLSVVPSHPYLGIEIYNRLSWKQHIEKTKHKSIRTLNMVRRNLTKGTTTQIRNQIFTVLVRPTLEYGCIVWDPHQTSRIQLLERVQNKGARYVMQDWDKHTSVSQMKLSLGWCTLQERRLADCNYGNSNIRCCSQVSVRIIYVICV